MPKFKIVSGFKPTGDQPQAVDMLVAGLNKGEKHQVLLGVTGSGKSVISDTEVLIKSFVGIIKKEKIGTIVDYYFSVYGSKIRIIDDTELIDIKDLPKSFRFYTYSFDPHTKISSWREVAQIMRHKVRGRLYQIQTACGRSVTATEDHNFFALRDGQLQLLRTSELVNSDHLPIPRQISGSSKLDAINISDYLSFNRKAYLSIPDIDILVSSSYVTDLSISHRYALLHNGQIPLKSYQNILNDSKILLNARVGTKFKKGLLPLNFKITNPFLEMLGYFIAEGHAEKNYFIISSGDEEVIASFLNLFKQYGIRTFHRPNTYDYVAYSSIFSDLIKNLCGSNSSLKHLPSFWTLLSNNQLGYLLKGYFSCDGGIDGVQVACSTKSKQLASDLCYALLRFGIIARVHTKMVKIPNKETKNLHYVVRISGKKDLNIFAQQINFAISRKSNKLASVISEKEDTNVDIIPINRLWLKKVRQEMSISQREIAAFCHINRSFISMIESQIRTPSLTVFINLMKYFRIKAINLGRVDLLEEIDNNLGLVNLFWTPVKQVKAVSGYEYVYDFAIPENETFLAGFGGLFVHNTFTMANVIEKVQKPTLIISHNKTLAGQLAQEFRSIFPENAVEYFVSYYDYYQPEAYVPSSDTYIEKDASINEEIEKLRLSATTSLMTRKDVIVVASVSAIYNLGSPIEYGQAILELKGGMKATFDQVLKILSKMFYERNDVEFKRGNFRVKGDTVDIFPAYMDFAFRVQFLGDKVEKVSKLNPVTADIEEIKGTQVIYPAKHYITPDARFLPALVQIEKDLELRLAQLKKQNKLVEAQRLEQRTHYDLEMMREFGYCNGIENYSIYFEGRKEGEPPYTLMEFFSKDFLVIIDESHITLPQIRGMYNGDRARKETLVEFGFRLPSALDNRPLKFDEFQRKVNQAVYVSATPDEYELSLAGPQNVAEQLLRPTGILDPEISVRPTKGQIDDVIKEVQMRVVNGERVLITTLTKRMAEDLSDYLKDPPASQARALRAGKGFKVAYLHSDIKTLERSDILNSLRLGEFDVLVGINLLREGLDLPEVSLVIILDADKEGFLRSRTSLVQTMGRAARHIKGTVIMYADNVTKSMQAAIDEVERRRKHQAEYNKKHNITPRSIEKALRDRLIEQVEELQEKLGKEDLKLEDIPVTERKKMVGNLEEQMKQAAELLDFEEAARIRDQIKELSV